MNQKIPMSEIMNKMKQVNEFGLNAPIKEQAAPKAKQTVNNTNSSVNHSLNYDKVLNNANPKKVVKEEVVLKENDKIKILGALQVIKEMVDSDLAKNPAELMLGIKKITSNF
jgi:hypothetical protein